MLRNAWGGMGKRGGSRDLSADSKPDIFATDHLLGDLKGRSVRGGVAIAAGQAAGFVLKIGSTAVLARLLTPADFGLIAMATALTGFVAIFNDAGLTIATVQRPEIDHEQVSTLFWINGAVGVALMVIVAGLAPAVVWFYNEPRLLPITLSLAALFPLSGLMAQHQALLRRQMRFGALAGIDLASQAIGVGVAILAAAHGATYWALVAMQGANALAHAVLVWLWCPWRPGMPRRGTGVRGMLAFGGHFSAFNFVNYWARNADNLLIGRYWGAGPLGLYSRAYGLMLLPLNQVLGPMGAVAMPALSRLQDRPAEFARYYLRVINALMWITGPLIAVVAACSEAVVVLIMGAGWVECIPVFRVLAVVAFLQPIYSSIGWIYTSRGRADRMLRWSVIASPAMVLAVVAGLPYGPIGVATGYVIVFLLLFPWTMGRAFDDTRLTLRQLGRAAAYPGAVSLLQYAVISASLYVVVPCGYVAQLAVGVLLATTVMGIALALVPSIRREGAGLLGLVRNSTPEACGR